MQPAELEAVLEQAMPDCAVTVGGDDYHYLISVTGVCFEGLGPVKRQQMVYRHIADLIRAGTVHAVSIQTQTPAESAK